MYQRVINYLDIDIWNVKLEELPKWEAIGINILRIIVLTVRYFARDKCADKASALTFYTLLTIVPVLAMAFGVAKGFGMESVLEEQIRKGFVGQEDVMNRILEVVSNVLSGTREELIAGIGIVVLLWSVLRILSSIEDTMNVIWQVKKPRVLSRKLIDYSALLIIAPILMVVASGLTVFITSTVRQYTDGSLVGSVVNFPLKILPYALIWLLMTFLYIVMPNTKVDVKSALIGGVLAGTAYQLTQWAYITFQIGASNANAIYGSFAALPLFLIWLQLSWIIVLVGAELTFAIQNVDDYEQKEEVKKVSAQYRKILILNITHVIIKRFDNEKKPYTLKEIGKETDIPQRLLRQLLEELVKSRIVSAIRLDDKITGYQPARDINKLTVHRIIELMDRQGVNKLAINETDALKKIEDAVIALSDDDEANASNLLLKDI
jgi:membrane protein